MFKLDENSMIVKIWAKAIKRGEKTIEDVPTCFGMRDAVKKRLELDKAEA